MGSRLCNILYRLCFPSFGCRLFFPRDREVVRYPSDPSRWPNLIGLPKRSARSVRAAAPHAALPDSRRSLVHTQCCNLPWSRSELRLGLFHPCLGRPQKGKGWPLLTGPILGNVSPSLASERARPSLTLRAKPPLVQPKLGPLVPSAQNRSCLADIRAAWPHRFASRCCYLITASAIRSSL